MNLIEPNVKGELMHKTNRGVRKCGYVLESAPPSQVQVMVLSRQLRELDHGAAPTINSRRSNAGDVLRSIAFQTRLGIKS